MTQPARIFLARGSILLLRPATVVAGKLGLSDVALGPSKEVTDLILLGALSLLEFINKWSNKPDLFLKIKRESSWHLWRNIKILGRNQIVLS